MSTTSFDYSVVYEIFRPPYNLANTFWECLQIREKIIFSNNAQPRNNYF